MEHTQLQPWSDRNSAPLYAPQPDPPHTPDSDRTIIIWDHQRSRPRLISRVAEACGVRPCWVNKFATLEQVECGHGCSIAVVALGTCPAPGDPALKVIRHLKQKGFTIISYEEGAQVWPLGVRCRALLAGASWVLDSATAEFTHGLHDILARCVDAEANRRTEEETMNGIMRQLGIVGESRSMTSVFRQVLRVSTLSDLPVLITGETGTGKDLLAHAIHQLDRKRRHGPFVALNCGALSPSLAESELFGHRRGAFTGAERERRGLIRAAEGGVLFLDEIGELDDALQVKLLRVLQERRVLGLGEDQEVSVSVRVIAATNRDLETMVQQRKFRADLFHRLSVLAISIPPLRERPADLKPLIEHLVKKHQALRPERSVAVGPDFVEALRQVDLPGNARQVENLVRRALVNKDTDTPLTLHDLPPEIWQQLVDRGESPAACPEPGSTAENGQPSDPETASPGFSSYLVNLVNANGWSLTQALEYCEKVLLEAALRCHHGNQSQTARLLGITPRSVYSKLRRYQLGLWDKTSTA
jgi:transcriptional regulator with GAF, ATPase, and Fis domain